LGVFVYAVSLISLPLFAVNPSFFKFEI